MSEQSFLPESEKFVDQPQAKINKLEESEKESIRNLVHGIVHEGATPEDKSPEMLRAIDLRAIEKELEASIEYAKKEVRGFIKYMIPLYPIWKAIKDSRDEHPNASERGTDIMMGTFGINVSMGLVMAVGRSMELLKEYRLLLQIRRELRESDSVAE